MEQAAPVPQAEKKEPVSLGELVGLVLKQLRWKQWPKNLIVYAPLLFSGKFFDPSSFVAATVCLIVFCMISSGIYVLNDIMDIKADRLHPTKRNRPIASGRLNLQLAQFIGAVLLLGGFLIGYCLRPSLDIVCLGYAALNVMYSLGLKNFAIIDILCVASGFVFRAVAGAVAVNVSPSGWFLLCTTLGALWLAMEKRRQEILLLSGDSTTHRRALSDYSLPLIDRFESLVVPSLLTSYAFYTFQQAAHTQWMMVTIPPVLYGLMRYQLLSERGANTGTPEEVLFKDRPIQIALLIWVLLCAFVVYGNPRETVRGIGESVDKYRLVP